MPRIPCPSCRKKIHLPSRLAGRRVTCPRCDAAITVPVELVNAVEEASAKETAAEDEDLPFPLPARLGIISLVFGMISTILLCLPLVDYISIGLSSLGLLLGLGGLFRSLWDKRPLPADVAKGLGIWNGIGTRVRDYPLAGMAVCLLALFLILLPTFMQWLSESRP